MSGLFRRLAPLVALSIAGPALAQPAKQPSVTGPGWYIQGGAYLHYDNDDEDYEGPPLFGGVEYIQSAKWLWGFSMFQNSFGQFSQYAYFGRTFRPLDDMPNVHIKLTGGVVHGYGGEHHDTLPIRWGDSWGIGVIPSVGYRDRNFGFDVAFLKASGVLFLAGWYFD